MGPVEVSGLVVTLQANDHRTLLQQQFPRQVWQAGCRLTLYDVACNADGTMAASHFQVLGACGERTTAAKIVAAGLPKPAGSGTYALGRVQMTSGGNAGIWRTVMSWDGAATIQLVRPLPTAPAVGDTFAIYPGCNKTRAACALFNNLQNYGGQDLIPDPETAV
jgi:uncharacterized phage protein (TIGR02218 family)